MTPSQLHDFSQSVAAVSVFGSNVLFWLESGYFMPASDLKPLLHTWSLGVEEQFYIVFPLLLIFAWRLGKRVIVAIIVVLAILSMALSEWGWRESPPANFYLTPSRAWELAIGALVGFVMFARSLDTRISPTVGQLASSLGLGLIVFSILFFNEATPFPGLLAMVPTLGTALIICFANGDNFVGRLLSMRLLVLIGLMSYSAYLWHMPLLAFARLQSFREPSPGLLLTLCLTTLLIAYISWQFVEKPFRNRRNYSRPTIFLGAR